MVHPLATSSSSLATFKQTPLTFKFFNLYNTIPSPLYLNFTHNSHSFTLHHTPHPTEIHCIIIISINIDMMHGTNTHGRKKLKGVRRRKWGKWVSEIRVPGTQERLWLGTYATPEAAAVAHDVAVYCLRRPSTLDKLNFPETLSSYHRLQQRDMVMMMSPRSVQKVASDVAMDVDARNIAAKTTSLPETETEETHVSVNDDHVCNVGAATDDNNNNSGVFCWEGFGDDELNCVGTNLQGKEALSISIEDYL